MYLKKYKIIIIIQVSIKNILTVEENYSLYARIASAMKELSEEYFVLFVFTSVLVIH